MSPNKRPLSTNPLLAIPAIFCFFLKKLTPRILANSWSSFLVKLRCCWKETPALLRAFMSIFIDCSTCLVFPSQLVDPVVAVLSARVTDKMVHNCQHGKWTIEYHQHSNEVSVLQDIPCDSWLLCLSLLPALIPYHDNDLPATFFLIHGL